MAAPGAATGPRAGPALGTRGPGFRGPERLPNTGGRSPTGRSRAASRHIPADRWLSHRASPGTLPPSAAPPGSPRAPWPRTWCGGGTRPFRAGSPGVFRVGAEVEEPRAVLPVVLGTGPSPAGGERRAQSRLPRKGAARRRFPSGPPEGRCCRLAEATWSGKRGDDGEASAGCGRASGDSCVGAVNAEKAAKPWGDTRRQKRAARVGTEGETRTWSWRRPSVPAARSRPSQNHCSWQPASPESLVTVGCCPRAQGRALREPTPGTRGADAAVVAPARCPLFQLST